MPKQETHLIRVEPEAKRVIVEEAKQRRLDQKQVASALILWFGKQDRVIRALILGHVKTEDVPNLSQLLQRDLFPS